MPYGIGYMPDDNGSYDPDSNENNSDNNGGNDGLQPAPNLPPESQPCKQQAILEGWDESDILTKMQMRSLRSILSQQIWEKTYKKYKDIDAVTWRLYLVDRNNNYQTGGTFVLIKEHKYTGFTSETCFIKVLEWYEPAQFNSNPEWWQNAVNYVKSTSNSQSFLMNYYSQKMYGIFPSDGWTFAEKMAKDYIDGTGDFAAPSGNGTIATAGTGIGLAVALFALFGLMG
jgi:hypothetical protein